MSSKTWRREEFTLPRLIVCEGRADAAFLRALIAARGLPEFNIRNPEDRGPSSAGGIDQIGALMSGFAIMPGFADLQSILIIVDSDLDPAANFQKVRQQIINVDTYRFEAPDNPLDQTTRLPKVSIALVPWHDEPGNLESFCLTAAKSASPAVATCVEEFANCSGAAAWTDVTKLGKMKLRSILAAQHKRNSFIGLGQIWRDAEHLIPPNHFCFDRIADVLEKLR